MTGGPTVTIALPVFNEEHHVDACLDAIAAQTYPHIVEVLVVDGRSTDRTVEVASARTDVTVVDNPRRIQASALNIALERAKGDVMVRVDGHCRIAPDYVERCVDALERTGAAMVGGAMRPQASGWRQVGIAEAMGSPLGAGPALFHRGAPRSGWVDTVYLGAYRVDDAVSVGGYAEDLAVNEDAEFAIRLAAHGGIYLDADIHSVYTPRDSYRGLARQFARYGRGRAATVRRHPGSLRARQLAAPLLVVGLLSPKRRSVVAAYAAVVVAGSGAVLARRREAAAGFALALPVMHLSWGTGFLVGLVAGPPAVPPVPPATADPAPGEA